VRCKNSIIILLGGWFVGGVRLTCPSMAVVLRVGVETDAFVVGVIDVTIALLVLVA
jgi:hypothetical protein